MKDKNQENLNFKLYYFLTFVKLTKYWGDFLKEENCFKQNDKLLFNNSLNGINNFEKLINKKLPENYINEMEDTAFLFNDLFDLIMKEKDLDKKEEIIESIKNITKQYA